MYILDICVVNIVCCNFTYCERLRVIHLLFFAFFACLQMKSLLVNAITPGTLNVFSHAGRRFDLAVYTMCGGMFAVVFVLVI